MTFKDPQKEFDALMELFPVTERDYKYVPLEALQNYLNGAIHKGLISLEESIYYQSQYKSGNITAPFLERMDSRD